MIGLDTNLLLGYFQARNGLSASVGGTSTTVASSVAKAPTPPWSTLSAAPKADEMLKSVLMGRKFIDGYQTQLDVKGASEDYRQLFAIHQGLATLEAMARKADDKDTSSAELKRIQAAFTRGMAEVSGYIDDANFDKLRLTYGDVNDKAKSVVGVPKTTPRYVTSPLHQGTATDPVEAFQGDMKFSVKIRLPNKVETTIDFDLAEMGSTTRSMNEVVKYINTKLSASGFSTRFAVDKIAGADKTTEVNGRTIKLGKEPDKFGLKIQGDTTEILTFSAPSTSPAVYITQTAGDPKPAKTTKVEDGKVVTVTPEPKLVEELVKFETGTSADAVRRPGDVNWVEGRVFNVALPEGVEKVHKTVSGPDGALYMLADVNDAIDGQTIKGAGDVALMKFDSAGKLVYARTLGASADATGLGLAVGPDGQIAVSGSVTGGFAASGVPIGSGTLETIPKVVKADNGIDETKPDSFVAVFSAAGDEVWSQRTGARDDDEATSVAFGSDGSLYVLGRAKGAMPGQTSSGNWDNYLRTFDADGRLKSTTQFGTSGEDKPVGLIVDGTSVVVASVEASEVQLRRFDMTDPKVPTLTATRSLGTLGGGSIAGVTMDGGNIVIAGSTGATLGVGNTTRASSGSVDAFAARISADLSSGSDAIAYYGGSGDDRATAITVADGKVWLTGTTKTDLPGMDNAVGKVDGFAVGLDIGTGAIAWSQRFTGSEKMTTPTSIAVDVGGASALDRLGLPTGKIEYSDSQLVTSATSARPGDTFQIRRRIGGPAVTITIEATDTLETLAKKIQRATSFGVKAEVVSDGDVRKLQIRPQNSRSSLEILGGKGGLDALEALGLNEGFVRSTVMTDGQMTPGDGGSAMYGLKMPRDLSLSTKDEIKATIDKLTMAMSVLRTAYRDLEQGMKPASETKKATGEVPAYLKNQLANYQAGLNRLTGGG
ncbi:hypothetical protein ASE17_03100 [Phenylobacterium sp. Root77]|uniref:hypothetical protein n=1 Tax=unclassified Phenylobacterium TaxID=2640670 RepID=UPI0006FC54CB|nr:MULTISPECIES: hypothetical protein [unclassified Phenylobacterium]KQW71884.1 hypothetical protein ASC73_07325 [Phenylobacterium sp. Root1277]KQW94804.1 hypothetical protein ASC79_03470 [Phenylobacterium sp. Root1290]KRC44497.1 hypothetical protein ASE17_03100 [Phenylobacterium sp. Root77]